MVNSTFLATYKRIRHKELIKGWIQEGRVLFIINIRRTCFRGKRMMFLAILSNGGRRRIPRESEYPSK